MSSEAPQTYFVTVNGYAHRVWSKGQGSTLGFLAGIGGLPQWTPLLDQLATSRRVIAPSLPGYPGGGGHEELDSYFDRILATHDILDAAGLAGADLLAVSVSGPLAADVAGVWPDFVRRLVLLAPLSSVDGNELAVDDWPQDPGHLHGLVCAKPETYKDFIEAPDAVAPSARRAEHRRALQASARSLFSNGYSGLAKRLSRIQCPLLLLRGSADQLMPASCLDHFAWGVSGRARVVEIADAGHLADLDQPDAVAAAVRDFLE